MTKKKKEMEPLSDGLSELYHLDDYLKECSKQEAEVDPDLALVLLRGLKEKIDYYQEKYEFLVEVDDQFFIEDYNKFMQKREVFRAVYEAEQEEKREKNNRKMRVEVLATLKEHVKEVEAEVKEGDDQL